MCVCLVCMYVCMCTCQSSEEDSWSSGTGVTCLVSCPAWMLGTNLWFSGRAANTLSLWAIWPAPKHPHTCTILKQRSHGLYPSLLILHPELLAPHIQHPGVTGSQYFIILQMWVFCLHVCLCTTCVQHPQRPEDGVRALGTGVTNGCEPPQHVGARNWILIFWKSSQCS